MGFVHFAWANIVCWKFHFGRTEKNTEC